MALTHTMTLTDREANLLHRWAKAELEKDDAVAAAWVLNGLIENHVHEWVKNKWHHDREGQMDEAIATAPTVEEENEKREAARKRQERVRENERIDIQSAGRRRGNKRMEAYKNGPTVEMEDFALAWYWSDAPSAVWTRLVSDYNAPLEMPEDYDIKDTPRRWYRRVGDKGVALRMSILAARLRKAGVPMKKMKRGRKKQVDDSARSTRT